MAYHKKRIATRKNEYYNKYASSWRNGSSKRKRRSTSRNGKFRKGYDRTSGYYGIYNKGSSVLPVELKFHDVQVDDSIVAAGSNIANAGTVNVIPQGVKENERIGRKAIIKSINWRYRVTIPENDALATPGAGDTIRVILYLDKQCNGAAATGALILEDATNHLSFNNLANKDRFFILMDRIHNLNYETLASDEAAKVSSAEVGFNFSFYKKCELPIEFNSVTGAITEIRSNNIGVLLVGFAGTGGFESLIRLRYTD